MGNHYQSGLEIHKYTPLKMLPLRRFAASRLRGVRVPNVPAGMNCARLTATFASHVYDKGAIDTIVAFFTN